MIIPKHNVKGFDVTRMNIKLIEVAKVEEAFKYLFS